MVVRGCCAAMLALACGPRVLPAEDAGDEGGASDTTGSASDSGTGTTSATGPTGTSVSGTSVTSGTTTAGSTAGGPGCAEDTVSGCAAYCTLMEACYAVGAGECLQSCVEEMSQDSEACTQAICRWYACLGDNDCASFEAGAYDCSREERATGSACPECLVGVGRGMCSYSCAGSGTRVECGATECTCYEDGQPVATCPIANVCADPGDALPLVYAECCGR